VAARGHAALFGAQPSAAGPFWPDIREKADALGVYTAQMLARHGTELAALLEQAHAQEMARPAPPVPVRQTAAAA
jgi:hypothetical protein